MTKRTRDEWQARKELQDAGWRVAKEDKVAFNSGSETVGHVVCKMLAGKYLIDSGYRVDSEVIHAERGEIDVVAYGLNDEPPFAVECETSPTEETIQDKLDRYVHGTPFCECYVLNVSEMPLRTLEAYEWVSQQL